MRPNKFLAGMAFAAALLFSGAASAQTLAYAVPGGTNMRAGPSGNYPVVATILGGSAVNVYGCVRDYRWCDVIVQGIRGWASANRLEFVYGGRRVLVPSYYSYFGAPVVGFDFTYWDRHYSGRPFYRERTRYGDRRERREDVQEFREERREDRRDTRVERRDERSDRQECLARGGTRAQCRQ
jgi:uncharacterized protein YraI